MTPRQPATASATVTTSRAPQLEAPETCWIAVPASALERDPADLRVHTADWPADGTAPPGAPLQVAVHGLGASYLNWLPLAPLLRRHGRVIAPDLVGFGRTPLGERRARVDDNVDLLRAFIEQVSPDGPVVLLGNSMGGLISITLAGRHPDLVRGLILINPALPRAGVSLPHPRVLLQFGLYLLPGIGEEHLRRRQRRTTPRQQVELIMELCGVAPGGVSEEYLEAASALASDRRAMSHAHPALLEASKSIVRRTVLESRTFWRDVDRITAPTLLLHGGRDRLVPLAGARALADRRPEWSRRFYPDLGHTPLIEDPQRVADHITSWRAAHVDGTA